MAWGLQVVVRAESMKQGEGAGRRVVRAHAGMWVGWGRYESAGGSSEGAQERGLNEQGQDGGL